MVLYQRFVANRRASSNDSRDQCGCYQRDYLGEHALSRKLSRRFARDRSAVSRFVVRPAARVSGWLSALSRKDAFTLEPGR